MRVTRTLGWVLFVWVVLAAVPSSAFAGPLRLRVEVSNGGGWDGVVITDNLAGDGAALSGVVSYQGIIGGANFSVTTGSSMVWTSPVETAELDLNSISVQYGGAGTVRLTLEDSSISVGQGYGELTAITNVSGVLFNASLAAQTWVNPTNAAISLGPDQATPGALAAIGGVPDGSVSILSDSYGSGAFSDTAFTTFIENGPYSLFSQVTINFTSAGSAMLGVETLVPVPEPGSLILLGTGLIGAARLARRRIGAERG